MEKFLAISCNNNYTLNIFDFEIMNIVELHNGVFTNITEECRKMTKRKNTFTGSLWYKFLQGEIDIQQAQIAEEEIKFVTDNKSEWNKFILSVQKKQIESLLEDCNHTIQNFENSNSYYTYRNWR